MGRQFPATLESAPGTAVGGAPDRAPSSGSGRLRSPIASCWPHGAPGAGALWINRLAHVDRVTGDPIRTRRPTRRPRPRPERRRAVEHPLPRRHRRGPYAPKTSPSATRTSPGSPRSGTPTSTAWAATPSPPGPPSSCGRCATQPLATTPATRTDLRGSAADCRQSDPDSRLPYCCGYRCQAAWCSALPGPGREPRRCTATRSASTSGPRIRRSLSRSRSFLRTAGGGDRSGPRPGRENRSQMVFTTVRGPRVS